ncbi:MAG: carbamoyl phosphate synthase small subunit, partial [Candidatus Saccharimonadales bacterium]
MEDGKTFAGTAFGATGTATGELVFNTSLFGYQEILTDPSYAGQVITMTYPEMGNYGANDEDFESRKVFARGMVVRHLSRRHSSWRAKFSLSQFLQQQGIIGIADVDTREITRHIRDKGALRCALSTEVLDPDKLVEIARKSPEMTGADFTGEVTTPKPYTLGDKGFHIAVLDFGCKRSILGNLAAEGCRLTVFPANTDSKTVLACQPDAIFLSNGPGDPAACTDALKEIPHLVASKLPIFGICLGH